MAEIQAGAAVVAASGSPEAAADAAAEGAPFPASDAESSPRTLLEGLSRKLSHVREELTVDLEVPRWAELIGLRAFVTYAPLTPSKGAIVERKFAKEPPERREAMVHAQCLIECCRGVWVCGLEDDPADKATHLSLRIGDPDGPPTLFDEDLARRLGLPAAADGGSAIDTCRAFYFTEGDLMMAYMKLVDWSAATSEELQRGFPTP